MTDSSQTTCRLINIEKLFWTEILPLNNCSSNSWGEIIKEFWNLFKQFQKDHNILSIKFLNLSKIFVSKNCSLVTKSMRATLCNAIFEIYRTCCPNPVNFLSRPPSWVSHIRERIWGSLTKPKNRVSRHPIFWDKASKALKAKGGLFLFIYCHESLIVSC